MEAESGRNKGVQETESDRSKGFNKKIYYIYKKLKLFYYVCIDSIINVKSFWIIIYTFVYFFIFLNLLHKSSGFVATRMFHWEIYTLSTSLCVYESIIDFFLYSMLAVGNRFSWNLIIIIFKIMLKSSF